MKNTSCCVVTILYNPSDIHIDNIFHYVNAVDKVYVYDNSLETDIDIIKRIESIAKCEYISNKRNDGIAKALNIVYRKAKKDGFQYIISLDQDSIIFEMSINRLLAYAKRSSDQNIGVWSPEICFIVRKEQAIEKEKEIENRRLDDEKDEYIYDINWAITSGSLIMADILKHSIYLDEKLFIDRVDYDYCLRLKEKGLRIVAVKGAVLYQFLGENSNHRIRSVQHEPIRHYYMFRNRMYIEKKHRNKNKTEIALSLIKLYLASTKHLMMIALFENKKVEKYRMVLEAIRDYRNNRMYKYQKEC